MWLARRRRELFLARRAAHRARRNAWRAAIASMRGVPLVRRLPCVTPRRRKKKILDVSAGDNDKVDAAGIDSDVGDVNTSVETAAEGGAEKMATAGSAAAATATDAATPSAVGVSTVIQGRLGEGDGEGGEGRVVGDRVAIRVSVTMPPGIGGTEIVGTDGRKEDIGSLARLARSADISDDEKIARHSTFVRRTRSTAAAAAAMAPASAKTGAGVAAGAVDEEAGSPVGNGSGDWKGRRRPGAALLPTRLEEHLRRRRKACTGLEQALNVERQAFANAGEEYLLALSDFDSDHSLEITWYETRAKTLTGKEKNKMFLF